MVSSSFLRRYDETTTLLCSIPHICLIDADEEHWVNDHDTADMLSKTMGRETITYETGGQSERDVMVKDPERSLSRTQHLATRNLMDSNEIMKRTPDTLLLMRVGENPLIVRKLRYYADKEFVGLFNDG